MPHSNLDCFINSTTPSVRTRILPKTSSCNLNSDEWSAYGISPCKDRVEFFNLGDLWDCYDEWSVYGVGSQIHTRGQSIVQYYTPYLSAIQIYTAKPMFSRHVGDNCDGEFDVKSWSSDSDDTNFSRSSSSSSDRMWDMDDISSSLEDHYPVRDRRGELYLEYFESDGPFGRVPLKDKIDALSQKHPGLKTLNSVDLSPASWMAVAWYPIYHIPACRNAKELYASFLTYHTLLSSFQDNMLQDMGNNFSLNDAAVKKELYSKREHNQMSLAPFGLATYRMKPRIWLNPETSDHERISSLLSAAGSWLKQLQVQHHDFNFFVSRRTLCE